MARWRKIQKQRAKEAAARAAIAQTAGPVVTVTEENTAPVSDVSSQASAPSASAALATSETTDGDTLGAMVTVGASSSGGMPLPQRKPR